MTLSYRSAIVIVFDQVFIVVSAEKVRQGVHHRIGDRVHFSCLTSISRDRGYLSEWIVQTSDACVDYRAADAFCMRLAVERGGSTTCLGGTIATTMPSRSGGPLPKPEQTRCLAAR